MLTVEFTKHIVVEAASTGRSVALLEINAMDAVAVIFSSRAAGGG